MKNYIITLLFVILLNLLHAKSNHNSIYTEIGGNGILASINYERYLIKHKFLLHGGIGVSGALNPQVTLPFGIKYNKTFGNRNHIEIGIGATTSETDIKLFVTVDRSSPFIPKWRLYPIPSLSYKYTSFSGYLFRASFCPVISRYGLIPWIGFSFGKSF